MSCGAAQAARTALLLGVVVTGQEYQTQDCLLQDPSVSRVRISAVASEMIRRDPQTLALHGVALARRG